MRLEDQVVSLENAKRLKELGVKQESLFSWFRRFKKPDCVAFTDETLGKRIICSAFTVAELGEMLPKRVLYTYSYVEDGYSYRVWSCCARYRESSKNSHINTIAGNTEAEARAKMLIYLLENKLMEVPR